MQNTEVFQNIPQTVMNVYEPASPDIQVKLYPTLEAVGGIYQGVLDVLDKNGLTEEKILTYLDFPGLYSQRQHTSVEGRDLHRLANQYEHVRKVMGATMELKRRLLENNLPETIVAYQSGTGWPKPEENEDCVKVDFIHYGEGPLAEFSPPGTKADKEAGIHVYRVKGKDGREITLLALMRRAHAYTETDWETASLDLAFMPRVLKGIGTEFILSTFASGVDLKQMKEGAFNKHDLAVLVGQGDESGLSAKMGPGTGDQRILAPIFGGAFKNIAAMNPDAQDVSMFIDVVGDVVANQPAGATIRPQVHAGIENDTALTPDFQNAYSHAQPRSTFDMVQKLETLPGALLDLFRGKPLALVHGMVQFIERNAYFQSWNLGIPSLWNRRLRELPVETFTDFSDPSDKGQSHEISDEAVKAAGKEAEVIMAKIITNFFRRYSDRPSPTRA